MCLCMCEHVRLHVFLGSSEQGWTLVLATSKEGMDLGDIIKRKYPLGEDKALKGLEYVAAFGPKGGSKTYECFQQTACVTCRIWRWTGAE